MSRVLVFCVLFTSAAVASAEETAAVNPPQKCSINNYNRFYAGPNKKVRNLLIAMKKQLDELQQQVARLTKCNSTTSEPACPKGWVRHGRSCFLLVDRRIPKWSDAHRSCQTMGADLPIIKSGNENQFIFDLLREKNGRQAILYGVWLGFHRQADSKFYWIDGTPLKGSYSAWKNGEPNNGRGRDPEDCGHMLGAGESQGKWNDLLCDLDGHWFWVNNPENIPFLLCQKNSS